jgi:hypothetical protein
MRWWAKHSIKNQVKLMEKFTKDGIEYVTITKWDLAKGMLDAPLFRWGFCLSLLIAGLKLLGVLSVGWLWVLAPVALAAAVLSLFLFLGIGSIM